jgi:hypothetical protein
MGHSRLGTLPDTAPWRRVVALLAEDADVAAVATATTEAALRGLERARNDPGLVEAVLQLTQLVLAARRPDFADALRDAGFLVPDRPDVFDLAAAFSERLDDHLRRSRGRTDLGELAQLAAVESVVGLLRAGSNNLFGTTPEDVHRAAAELAKDRGFGHLAHTFFANFTQRFLTYHLERELPLHVGGNGRFASPRDHDAFVEQLAVHSREVAAIMRDYAAGWFGKANAPGGGGVTPPRVRKFVNYTLTKIRGELELRGARDD